MVGLSVEHSDNRLGIDGAVMVIVQDLLKDSAKESRFRAAMKSSGLEQDVPQKVRGVRAINLVYGLTIPEHDASSYISHDLLLEKLTGGQKLSLGIGADIFYETLARCGEMYLNILQEDKHTFVGFHIPLPEKKQLG